MNELRMLQWVVSLHVKETEVSISGGQESSGTDTDPDPEREGKIDS